MDLRALDWSGNSRGRARSGTRCRLHDQWWLRRSITIHTEGVVPGVLLVVAEIVVLVVTILFVCEIVRSGR